MHRKKFVVSAKTFLKIIIIEIGTHYYNRISKNVPKFNKF